MSVGGANAGAGSGGLAGTTGAGILGRGIGDTGNAARLGVGGDTGGAAIETRGGTGAALGAAGVRRAALGVKSARASPPAAMVITPPQTEQRARTLAEGILAGSTRKTERHSGHTTFMSRLQRARPSLIP